MGLEEPHQQALPDLPVSEAVVSRRWTGSYAVSGDDRLARQAIEAFDQSRRHDGIVSSRYPTAVPHDIPPFSLLWVGMVHDFWMHRDDPAFVRAVLPGTRTALDWFLERQRPDGVLGRLEWWPFLDWASDFAPAPVSGLPLPR